MCAKRPTGRKSCNVTYDSLTPCSHALRGNTSLSSNWQVNTIIEIHDSTVAEIASLEGTVVVHFLPAYLHKSEGRPGIDSGTGWVQEGRLIFTDASVRGDLPNLPCNVMDGELIVDGEQHDNGIPVPLEVTAPSELCLSFCSAHVVKIIGRGVRLDLVGEPRYVEEFEG
jgi:hypothetical protein